MKRIVYISMMRIFLIFIKDLETWCDEDLGELWDDAPLKVIKFGLIKRTGTMLGRGLKQAEFLDQGVSKE